MHKNNAFKVVFFNILPGWRHEIYIKQYYNFTYLY